MLNTKLFVHVEPESSKPYSGPLSSHQRNELEKAASLLSEAGEKILGVLEGKGIDDQMYESLHWRFDGVMSEYQQLYEHFIDPPA